MGRALSSLRGRESVNEPLRASDGSLHPLAARVDRTAARGPLVAPADRLAAEAASPRTTPSGTEDFSVAPVESTAAGRLVIAPGYGDVSETGTDGHAGLRDPTVGPSALEGGILRSESLGFDASATRDRASVVSCDEYRLPFLQAMTDRGVL